LFETELLHFTPVLPVPSARFSICCLVIVGKTAADAPGQVAINSQHGWQHQLGWPAPAPHALSSAVVELLALGFCSESGQ